MKVLLALKSSFNFLYIYILNLLFLHIPECNLLIKKFSNAYFTQDNASLKPSEVVKKNRQ